LPEYPFQVDHIIAKKHHGEDKLDNLVWACSACNLGKSSNLSGRDLDTGRTVELFNPRELRWTEHFEWQGAKLQGLTACGRATENVLNINIERRVRIRLYLIVAGRFPPDDD
jgi:hypothetical protein